MHYAPSGADIRSFPCLATYYVCTQCWLSNVYGFHQYHLNNLRVYGFQLFTTRRQASTLPIPTSRDIGGPDGRPVFCCRVPGDDRSYRPVLAPSLSLRVAILAVRLTVTLCSVADFLAMTVATDETDGFRRYARSAKQNNIAVKVGQNRSPATSYFAVFQRLFLSV